MNRRQNFWVRYRVTATSQRDAETKAMQISIEQSVEMPPKTVPREAASNIGQVGKLRFIKDNEWHADIHFNKQLVDGDLTQFLNVLFGNSSLQPWCSLVDIDTDYLGSILNGPAFGIHGIRELTQVKKRALSCAVLKPVGASPVQLAEMAFQFASGGVDLIKDDHGLTNQHSADFETRVKKCVNAVRKAEQKSGKRTLYFPNITTSPTRVMQRFERAVDLGADGVLISPMLTGLESLHDIAKSETIPVMAHPAFSGSFVINECGIAPPVYYGKLIRAFGADSVIYPNATGRFSFNPEVCKQINRTCRSKMDPIKPAFPTAGGGIDLNTIADLVKSYGNDIIFLIGGSLYQYSAGLASAAKEFQQALTDYE